MAENDNSVDKYFLMLPVNKDELKRLLEESIRKILNENISVSEETTRKDVILNVKEASELLNLAKQTIYGLTSRNQIPFFKRGKKLYFKKQELLKWIEEGRAKTTTETNKEADEYLKRNSFLNE